MEAYGIDDSRDVQNYQEDTGEMELKRASNKDYMTRAPTSLEMATKPHGLKSSLPAIGRQVTDNVNHSPIKNVPATVNNTNRDLPTLA